MVINPFTKAFKIKHLHLKITTVKEYMGVIFFEKTGKEEPHLKNHKIYPRLSQFRACSMNLIYKLERWGFLIIILVKMKKQMKIYLDCCCLNRPFDDQTRELGIVDFIRFIQEFETGEGDYTKDRHKWQDKYTVEKIIKEIKKRNF